MKKYLVMILIVFGIYLIVFRPFNQSWLPFGNKGSQTAEMNNVDMIEVDVSGISTTIIPDSRDNLKAELDGKGKLSVKQSGDTVKVEVKRKWFDGINFFNFFKKRNLTIRIPEDYQKDMDIDLGSGKFNFSGKSMKLNEVNLDMSSGKLTINDLNTNQFKLDGSSGNINLNSVTAKKGTFDISSGKVNLNHYKGAIEAELSSGGFKAQLDELTDSVDIKANSGKVNLDLPKDADFTLNGKVSSGNISSDFPLKNQEANGKDIKGTYGSEKHKIDLQVSSGSIAVY